MTLTENDIVFAVLAICPKIHSISNVFMIQAIFCEFLETELPPIDLV